MNTQELLSKYIKAQSDYTEALQSIKDAIDSSSNKKQYEEELATYTQFLSRWSSSQVDYKKHKNLTINKDEDFNILKAMY